MRQYHIIILSKDIVNKYAYMYVWLNFYESDVTFFT